MNGITTRVHIVSCEEGAGAWYHQSEMLRSAFPQDSSLELVGEPSEADVILITDLRDRDDYFQSLREHPSVKQFPEKCFAVGEDDKPPRWLRGIQTSMTQSSFNLGRFRSGAYTLFHHDFLNPYVRAAAKAPPPRRDPRYLFTFIGRGCIPMRRRLLTVPFFRSDVLVSDSSAYNAFTHDRSGRDESSQRYLQLMLDSKFALCPRGIGAASIRLFEALSLGVAPIIISDRWLLPPGPRWGEIALFVRETELDQIERIAIAHESEWEERGYRARLAFNKYFSLESYVRYLVNSALEIKQKQHVPERWIHRLWPVAIQIERARRRAARVHGGLRRRLSHLGRIRRSGVLNT